jgi:hypothetical protein
MSSGQVHFSGKVLPRTGSLKGESMANLSKTTQDHEEIRRWAEERGAHPACVRGTGGNNDIGMLRLDFPGYSGEESLQEISWDDFFEKFDERGLALLYQEETAGGERSNFNKLVSAETAAEANEPSHGRKRSGSRKKTTSKSAAASKSASKSSGSASARKASPVSKKAAKKAAGKKASSASKKSAGAKKAAPLKKTASKKAAKKAPAKKAAAKKGVKKTAAPKKAAKKTAAKKTATKKGAGRRR